MSNPTTPFGWQMPTNTDLVTDLPADFEVFGQAVATSMQDLLGGTTGQVLKKNTNADMDFVWSADAAGMTNPMTTTGDVIYSSPGSTPVRLGIGTANQQLRVNSGATAPEWFTPAAVSSALTLIGTTSFSSSSAVNVNDVFSATYANYLITSNFSASTGGSARLRLRVSGSDDTNATYAGQYLFLYGSTVDCSRAATGTYFDLGGVTGSDTNTFTLQIARPFDSVKTQAIFDWAGGTGVNIQRAAHGFNFNATTSFTGFTLYPSTGTITGDVRVYGLANS